MSTELVLITVSLIILLSYAFDILSPRTRLSAVIPLLVCGIALRLASDWSGLVFPYLDKVLPALGTLGLILIVLEAGLDLQLSTGKAALIRRSLVSAAAGLLLCLFSLTAFFALLFGEPLRVCFINALPFSVISSAIAIPGARLLAPDRREFITYESSFSDILGILLFNFMVQNTALSGAALGSFALEIALTVIISLVFSLGLAALLERLDHPVKHLPVFAVVLLAYAGAKLLHFSPLILVLVFGLLLNNAGLLSAGRLERYFRAARIREEVQQFKSVIGETTFVIKTFFFVLLGYSADLRALFSREAALVVLPLAAGAYLSRALVLRLLLPSGAAAELTYVAPRGLITILLFLSVPGGLRLRAVPDSALLWTIMLTSLVMTWGVAKHAAGVRTPAGAPAQAG